MMDAFKYMELIITWLNKNEWSLLLTVPLIAIDLCRIWQLQSPPSCYHWQMCFRRGAWVSVVLLMLVSCFLPVFGQFHVSSSKRRRLITRLKINKWISLLNFNLRAFRIAPERTELSRDHCLTVRSKCEMWRLDHQHGLFITHAAHLPMPSTGCHLPAVQS